MREFSKIFKALADPNRLRILKMLEIKPLCVCEIQAVLGLAASTVSKHLSILRDAGFILEQKDKKWVIYSLSNFSQNELINHLLPLVQKYYPKDELLKQDMEKVKKVDRKVLCNI